MPKPRLSGRHCLPKFEALEPRVLLSAVTATSADAFVDTIGFGTHWNYLNTSYGSQFNTIKQKIDDLDIRWVRDGLHVGNATAHSNFMQLHNELGLLTTDAIQDKTNNILDENKIANKIDQIDDFADALLFIEGPNEYDLSSDPNKYATLRSYMDNMYRQVKASNLIGHLDVVGPSMANGNHHGTSYLGNISADLDFGNVHPYSGGRRPDTGHLDWWLSMGNITSGGKPLIATEAGYHTALNYTGGFVPVSEAAEAKYLPRMFMVHFKKGVAKTASYELIDLFNNPGLDNEQHNFGILRADGSEKPAFGAVENLIDLLKERDPDEAPIANFNLGSLDYTLSGDLTDVQSHLFQKSDGTFQLAIWQEVSVWDRTNLVDTTNADRPITLTFNQSVTSADVYVPLSGMSAVNSYTSPNSINLSVPDHVVIVDITPAGSSGGGGSTSTVAVSKDAYVRGGAYATTNYGSADSLSVKDASGSDYDRKTYLQFDLSAQSGTVSDATLDLYVANTYAGTSAMTIEVQSVGNDSWDESTLTWSNAPAAGTALATINGASLTAGSTVSVDLTTAVNDAIAGDGKLSVALVAVNAEGSDRSVSFASAEALTGAAPVLTLTGGGSTGGGAGGGSSSGSEVATHDAFVCGGSQATTNFGSSDRITVKESGSAEYNRVGYLRFDLSGYAGMLNDATLRLPVVSAGVDVEDMTIDIREVSDNWTETGITWNSAPSYGSTLASFSTTGVGVGSVVEVDLTAAANAAVSGDTKLSIALVATNAAGSERHIGFGSEENSVASDRTTLLINAGTGGGGGSNQTVTASDDAFIRGGGFAGYNYGSNATLTVKNDPSDTYDRITYVRFDLSSYSGNVSAATLDLSVLSLGTDASNLNIEVQAVSNDSWNQGSLTWNNAPTRSTTLATINGSSLSVGSTVSIDLTAAVDAAINGDGILSLALFATNSAHSERYAGFGSIESGATAPSLSFTTS